MLHALPYVKGGGDSCFPSSIVNAPCIIEEDLLVSDEQEERRETLEVCKYRRNARIVEWDTIGVVGRPGLAMGTAQPHVSTMIVVD